MEKAAVFDVMLTDLMTQWAVYASTKEEAACRPPEFGARMTWAKWNEYAAGIEACSDRSGWNVVHVTELMHDRIRHMFYAALRYDADAHDREDAVDALLN